MSAPGSITLWMVMRNHIVRSFRAGVVAAWTAVIGHWILRRAKKPDATLAGPSPHRDLAVPQRLLRRLVPRLLFSALRLRSPRGWRRPRLAADHPHTQCHDGDDEFSVLAAHTLSPLLSRPEEAHAARARPPVHGELAVQERFVGGPVCLRLEVDRVGLRHNERVGECPQHVALPARLVDLQD